MAHFADRLTEAIKSKRTPLCVGLDPRWESLPEQLRSKHRDGSLAGVARVLDIVAPLVPAVKFQSAFFESAGAAGMEVLQRLLRRARRRSALPFESLIN